MLSGRGNKSEIKNICEHWPVGLVMAVGRYLRQAQAPSNQDNYKPQTDLFAKLILQLFEARKKYENYSNGFFRNCRWSVDCRLYLIIKIIIFLWFNNFNFSFADI